MEKREKTKKMSKKIFVKVTASILVVAMVLATCSTFIYYLMTNI